MRVPHVHQEVVGLEVEVDDALLVKVLHAECCIHGYDEPLPPVDGSGAGGTDSSSESGESSRAVTPDEKKKKKKHLSFLRRTCLREPFTRYSVTVARLVPSVTTP